MKIHGRKSWGARKPRPRTRQDPHNVRELFIHWNGSSPRSFANIDTVAEEESIMRGTQDFHMGPQREWSDFAYSFAIFPSGRVYRGRGMDWVPASQLNHNTNTASCIVFLGTDDKIPDAVIHAIKELRKHCEARAGHALDVRPHRAVTQTDCPGPRLTELANRL